MGRPRVSFTEIYRVKKYYGVPMPPCNVLCVILRLAISVKQGLVTDGQTDTQEQLRKR